jgi:ABC-type nitrate/sulfonate/bicarbonate transport system ATPase subunit/ABC-type nitrate/sulfonate/bicarbonate transport system permease component
MFDAMVKLQNVVFSYPLKGEKVPVLAEISAEFARGKITAIVGRSGCGKTSLLRLIAGLSAVDSGSIAVDGQPGGRVREKTSIIFQDYGLLPWASVRGNAEMGLKARGLRARERAAIVDPILRELGLYEFARLYPARLSGGMRQRVAVARALAGESDLLLLDEPFSSLDAITRESLQDTLLATQRKHLTTMILVTHSIEEAAYLADTVYILEGKNPARLSSRFDTRKNLGKDVSTLPNASKGRIIIPRLSPPAKDNELSGAARRGSESYFMDIAELRNKFAAAALETPRDQSEEAAAKFAGQARRAGGLFVSIGRTAIAAAAVFLLWGLLSALLKKPFLPTPLSAARRFIEAFADGTLATHALASLRRIFLALAIAGPPAWALGLISGRVRGADALASPLVYLLHPLPKVAFLPILLLFFGLGDASKVALMGLVVFGQLFVGARDSARSIPSALIETVRSLGGKRGAILRWAILPATLPSLLSSLRISLGTAIAVLFLSETFASMDGLGWYIMDSWSRVDYPDMYAAIMALSALGLALYLALDIIERIALRWRDID